MTAETEKRVKQLIKNVRGMPREQRWHIIRHDLNSVYNPIREVVLAHKERLNLTQKDDLLDTPTGVNLTPQLERRLLVHRLRKCQGDLEYACNLTSKEVTDDLRMKFIENAPDALLLFPILQSEMLFLSRPTIEDYKHLVSQQVGVNSILRIFAVEEMSEDTQVNGVTAIKLINIAGNARKYHYPETVIRARRALPNTVEIQNLSDHPLPDDPFGLGVKGSLGNRGLGLHIVDLLGRADGTSTEYECQKMVTSYGNLYKICFTVPLQFPPV